MLYLYRNIKSVCALVCLLAHICYVQYRIQNLALHRYVEL